MGGVLAHIARAIAAAVLGSIVGTLFMVFVVLRGDRDFAQASSGVGGILFIFSLFFTIPSALFLAAPIIWPFREWALRHPWRAALVYGAIGCFAGAIVAALFADGAGQVFLFGGVYGAALGMAFIGMLWWTSPRYREPEPLDTIFE